jgi:hypothetical protein
MSIVIEMFFSFFFQNRPAHKSPGERSSQYAAESSCRERHGELTEWLTFIDTDEYMVSNWHLVIQFHSLIF